MADAVLEVLCMFAVYFGAGIAFVLWERHQARQRHQQRQAAQQR